MRSFVRSFACACVALIKRAFDLDERNDVTANMAALAVCMCLAASRLLDTPRSSGWVTQARRTLAQKFTVIVWCEGAALAIGTWIFRGCRRQPIYCFQIDVFIWLHVTDIYIYIYIIRQPTVVRQCLHLY